MIFSKKKRKYEETIDELRRKIKSLESENQNLKKKMTDMESVVENTPEDCTRGKWCGACEFSKEYHITESYGLGFDGYSVVYLCGRGSACKNFMQKMWE